MLQALPLKIALKYCGSCNPDVGLGAIGRRIQALVAGDATFVPLTSGEADLVLILNGCGVACADRPDIRMLACAAIVVAGESVELRFVPEGEIPRRVAQMIGVKDCRAAELGGASDR